MTLTGALALDLVALDRPGFSGRIGAALDFASTGRSPGALVNGLAGSGTVTFAGAALARSDPTALDRVLAKAQTPDAPLDETNIAFAFSNELNRAPLAIADGSAPLSLSAGVAKIGPIKIAQGQGDGTLNADFDLRTLDTGALYAHFLGQRFEVLVRAAAERGGDGRNALEAPKRQIDVSSLSAALAAQAIARETDRISTMEADIRERAFFNRRLKGERLMDRRQQEIQDWEAEQARLKGQADRLRDLEEAEKAADAEATRKAAEAAAAKRAAEAAADKAAAAKAERDRGRRAGEGRPRRPGGNDERPVRPRSGAEERPGRRQWSALLLPRPRRGPRRARRKPNRSRASSTDGTTRCRLPALAGRLGAFGLEHEHADGR